MRLRPATAPALSVLPSMIEASSSFVPALVRTAPLPALKRGESSRMRDGGLDRVQTAAAVLEDVVAREHCFLAASRDRPPPSQETSRF